MISRKKPFLLRSAPAATDQVGTFADIAMFISTISFD
jgi:hypothetical protein